MFFETEPADTLINRYFVTERYTDEAIKRFFADLKQSGIYEDSIIIIYGDHYGISKWHNDALAEAIGLEEITPLDNIQLQRVPLIIHIPGMEGETISTVSGQIDLKPTILNLLGVKTNHIHFGTDLFADNRDEFTILRDSSFITDEVVYTEDKCYDKNSGKEIAIKLCQLGIEITANELKASDNIIYGDLLRFLEEK